MHSKEYNEIKRVNSKILSLREINGRGANHVEFHTSPIATGQMHMGLQYESI